MAKGKNPYIGMDIAMLTQHADDLRAAKRLVNREAQLIDQHTNMVKKALSQAYAETGIKVSDHALVRYMDRIKHFDIETMRQEIIKRIRNGQEEAENVVLGESGEFYVMRGKLAITVLPPEAEKRVMRNG